MITRRSLFTLAAGAAVAPIAPLLPKPAWVRRPGYRSIVKLFGDFDARASLKMLEYLKMIDRL